MTISRFSRNLRYRSWWSLRKITFWGGAVAVGLTAIAFAQAANAASRGFQALLDFAPWCPLLLTPAGLALALALTRHFFPGAEGSGIPQSIAALEMDDTGARNAVLSLRLAAGKILMTIIALAVGGSVGREGPTVQVGASIMHWLGERMHLTRPDLRRALILAGGAAGVAAAFNTPLAGVVFGIEELSRSFEARSSGTAFTAVILAGITSLALLGNYHYFGHSDVALDFGRGWLAVAACGAAGGLAGGLFAQGLILAGNRGLPGALGRLRRNQPVLFAGLCGLLMAAIGLATGNATFGTGYEQANLLLHGGHLSALFAPAKLAATMLSYLSGIPGGIFAPSLSIGSGLGAAMAPWLPQASTAAIVLLGMVAYFSGVVQAPITAVVIVLEMTDNGGMTVALMAAALIAFAISRQVCPVPFYKALAEKFLATRKAAGSSGTEEVSRNP